MALLDLIKHRKSVRRFLDKPVEREKIMMCLEAARLAPSACNSQPWKFIVVDDRQLKDKLCESAFRGIYSMNTFCKMAPVMVVIISEKSKFLARIGGMFRSTKYYLIDIGIAGEHFVLQAEELGLGTCWIGWFNERAVKSVLNIPQEKKIDVLIALGYYDREKLGRPHSREPMNKIASFNSY
ncbi:MAG TPA: nitroreductase family protein [Dehalococcoidales bacterium]|nr:nitroreductase family protein [Dehalococcoidales bacterium]